MSDKIVITRNQLAKFLPNPETIKAFERLLRKSTVETPTDIEGIAIDTATASNIANESLSIGLDIQKILEFIATSPIINNEDIADIKNVLKNLLIAPMSANNEDVSTLKTDINNLQSIPLMQEHSDNTSDSMLLPPKDTHGFADLDYIQFRNTYQRVKLPGQLHWSYTYGDLQFTHIGGLVQNIGIDSIAHAYNNSGATINKGEVVYYTGTVGDEPTIAKFIANGTIQSEYLIGIASETISNNSLGHVTITGYVRDINASGSLYTETWNNADILFAHPTIAGGLTKVKPTAPNNSLPVAIVINNSATTGSLYVRSIIEQQLHYGSFSDSTDQTAAVINTAYGITFNTSAASNGVTVGTPTSRIVCTRAGLYDFSFSCQITSNNASAKTLWFWARKNGTDIANTAFKVGIFGSNVTTLASRSTFFSMLAGDYIEAMWATDDINVTLEAAPATAFAPATPSAIMSVSQIAQ